MWLGTRHLLLRCATVWLTVTTAALLAAAVALPGVARMSGRGFVATGAPTFDGALVEVASCAVLGCAAWLWLTTTLTVDPGPERAPGERPLRRTPLGAGGVRRRRARGPAATRLGRAGPPRSGRDRAPLSRPRRRPTPADAAPAAGAGTRRGGQARRLASGRSPAHDLGPGAGDAEIADRWHALYAANRARIGPDPDLVEPGLRLLLPGKDPS